MRNIIFLDLNPKAMVGYSFIIDKNLRPDGSNLSSVLFDICVTQGRKQEVLNFIGELPEQAIADVVFLEGPRQEVMVQLVETFGQQETRREAPLLSDGTLRVLAIAAALLSAPTGGLVVVEEIDNGVHPNRAKQLLHNILTASKANSLRVLLTSHNPALLDALPRESVPNVVCCYRDPEQGDSRLIRLSELTDYPELVASGPLGQLMTQGLLDRYLKNQRTPEQKTEQAQEWLRQLQLNDEDDL
ncbi:MAG: ATP-binding protein [Bacteroidota bacterium]|nr:ATP-binding protein [Bacteroidota bacterium]